MGDIHCVKCAVVPDASENQLHRLNASIHHYPQHAKARREAFGWYHNEPPSPEVAHSHFVEKARQDPANRAIYEEALEIFLGTCWKTRAPNHR